VFNGSRFRNEIAPRMREFWATIDGRPAKPIPEARVKYAKKINGVVQPNGIRRELVPA